MKIQHLLKTSLLAGLLALAIGAASTANAATQTWNPGGAGGGAGAWNLSNWDSAAAWTANNTAVFGGTAGTVSLNSTTQSVNGLTFNVGGYTIATGTLSFTGAPTTITTNGGTTTIAPNATLTSAAGAQITKTGAGTLSLSASYGGLGTAASPAAWTITGGTLSGSVYDSILSVTGGNNLGPLPSTGTVQLILDAGTASFAGASVANRWIQVNAAGGTLQVTTNTNIDGQIFNNADSSHTLYAGISTGLAQSFSGIISGNGSLTKFDVGTLTLAGTNTYAGGTVVNAGTLKLGNASGLGSANGGLAVNAGTLDMGGFSFGVGNFTGTGGTVFNSTNATNVTLTIGNNNASGGSYAGVIANNGGGGASGTVALLKTGSGTLTLTGNNTYSGATTISGGTLQIGSGTDAGSISATGSITNNGSLVYNVGGGTRTLGVVISGNGTLTQNSAGGTLVLTGNNTYTGNTTISAGTLRVGNGTDAGSINNSGAIINSGALVYNVGSGNRTVQIMSGNGSLTQSGTGVLLLNASNTFSGGVTVNSGTLGITAGSGLGAPATTTFAGNGTLRFENTLASVVSGARQFAINSGVTATIDTQSFNGTVASLISGSGGSLKKSGSGVLTLTANNTYTGVTTVSTGTLLINGSTSTSSAVTVDVGATLGGNGTVGGFTTVNGDLKPGNSPGVLTFSSGLTLNGTTTMEIVGATTPGTDFDKVVVTSGTTTFGGALVFTFGPSLTLANNTDILLFGFAGTSLGNFSGVTSTGSYSGTWLVGVPNSTWTLSSGGQTLTFSEVTGNLNVVPEPATWALLAFSLTTVMVLRRRRQA